MPNIFSGLFDTGGGGNSLALAEYNQRLKDYEIRRDAYDQKQALQNIDPYIAQVLESMSPERQEHIKLQRAMMRNQPLFDKGMEGFSDTIKQRGTTIADILKQDKTLERTKAKRDYFIDNPLPGEESSKIEVAKAYIGEAEWERLNSSSDPADRAKLQGLMRDAWRDRQYLDQGDQFIDPYKRSVIEKRLVEAGVKKESVPLITSRLQNFYSSVNQVETDMETTSYQRERIKYLYNNAEGNTGWWSLAASIPDIRSEGGSREWQQIKDTVISNVGLDKILDLKASSAQGATGLGALNEKELEMLQKHKGSLEQANSPAALKRVLAEMDKDLDRLQKVRLRQLGIERSWFNRNKVYIGQKTSDPDLIPESQEYLFSGKPYVPVRGETDLGESENELDDIKKKWNLED